ncbi:acyl-CoA thioesterase [Candidatus Hepatincolaceae symbiont of Richtersius coronifer]
MTLFNSKLEEYIHALEVDITYQDTDMAGMVYFANYFNYGEKARANLIRKLMGKIKFNDNQNWAVRKVNAHYISPVRIEDKLLIKTKIVNMKQASLLFAHDFYIQSDLKSPNQTKLCVQMEVELLSINERARPIKIDEKFLAQIKKLFKEKI